MRRALVLEIEAFDRQLDRAAQPAPVAAHVEHAFLAVLPQPERKLHFVHAIPVVTAVVDTSQAVGPRRQGKQLLLAAVVALVNRYGLAGAGTRPLHRPRDALLAALAEGEMRAIEPQFRRAI